MPWKTLCGFPPNGETITLRVPNGLWRPDTVITDYEGTEMFVLLDQVQQMRSYEAIFGDLDGRRLVCIKRHIIAEFWRDGYYFCTYKPNYKGQRPLLERDVDNKKVYPFSYLQVSPMKGRFYYRIFDNQEGLSPPKMRSENPWLGFMVVCCTPMVRTGKWTASFQRKNQNIPTIYVDQWRNCVDIGPGNDVLAALCMAYVFDRYQCQPLITVVGGEKEQYLLQPDDQSIESDDDKDVEGQQQQAQQGDDDEASNSRYLDSTPHHQQQRGSFQNDDDDENYEYEHDANFNNDVIKYDDNSTMIESSKYDIDETGDVYGGNMTIATNSQSSSDFVAPSSHSDTTDLLSNAIDEPSFFDQTTTPSYNDSHQPTIYENDDDNSSAIDSNQNRAHNHITNANYETQSVYTAENDYDDQSSGWYSTGTDDNSSALFSSSSDYLNSSNVIDKSKASNSRATDGNSSKMPTVDEYDDEDDEPRIV